MVYGLKDLHKQKIMHRDLKPANIFHCKELDQVKLGDLNVATVMKNSYA